MESSAGSKFYLSADAAQKLDVDLMGPEIGYNVNQLMELAGLSVAQSLHDYYEKELKTSIKKPSPKVLTVCGPGNNGGDGLVAARHLYMFGYSPVVFYPKRPDQ